MSQTGPIRKALERVRRLWVPLALWAATIGVAAWLRRVPYSPDPLLNPYLEIVAGLIALTFAANALVRFRGTHDRMSLFLALGFLLSGLIESAARLAAYRSLVALPETHPDVPLSWMASRTLLAAVMVVALVVERRNPHARQPDREIIGSVVIVGMVGYLIGVAYFAVPARAPIYPGAFVPRPWDLLPAAIYVVATLFYWQRLASANSAFDRAVCLAAGLSVACHLAASQSQRQLDAPFALAEVFKAASYAVALGGALLDNSRLFDRVHHLATSDPLTGLANYRWLMDVLENEMERSGRTGRPFAVLLLDLDGLKHINDRYGHLVGSHTLQRLANILRVHCRSIDTAARYGGDEFALVLPETGEDAARRVAARVCDRVVHDAENPPITVSVGVAVYPRDGERIDRLLRAADHALYEMKARREEEPSGQESPTSS
jgi:diguanylate cyclase (GGDEF)-like protein